jgi:hypothetical protein
VGKEVSVAWAENEGAAELEGVTAEFVLMVAGGFRPFTAFEIVAAKKVKNVGGFQIGNFVGLAVLVDEEWEVDSRFLLKDAGVVGIAETNGGKGGLFFAEGLLVLAQLRDVFATKDSTVMAKEYEDGGMGFPERAEANGFAKSVGENDTGEPLTECFCHDGP